MEPIQLLKRNGMTIKIYQDEEPVNPREDYDHAGTMVCWHRRYKLGDEQPRGDAGDWLRQFAAELVNANDADLIPDRHIQRILEKHCLILPLYLYDHSGITMSCNEFSCGWDSGQVGFIYVTKETIDKEWNGDRDKARECLIAEVKEYDDYLTGNCYGYRIEDEEGNDIDSCWGFLGDVSYCLGEALGSLEHIVSQPNYSI